MLLCTLGGAAQTEQLTTLIVGATLVDDVSPLVYAEKTGMFRREGLDVQIAAASNGASMASAVLSGAYQIGKAAVITAFTAHAHGVPLVLIAPGGVYDSKNPYALLVVPTDSTYRSAKDLNGKLIAVPSLHEFNQVVISAWVDQNGGDSRTLRFVEVPISATPAALAEHRVDASVLLYPALGVALDSGNVRVLAPVLNGIAPRFLLSAWFTSKDWAAQHPDLVAKFARVLAASAAYTNVHHAETAPMIADITGIALATVQRMVRTNCATSLNVADIQPVIDAAAKYGAISQAFPARELLFGDPAAR
jgi:NitT/TauT family transport system substrate-binding protein